MIYHGIGTKQNPSTLAENLNPYCLYTNGRGAGKLERSNMSGDHGLNAQTGRDNKFKRRTSYHNLRLDVGRAVTGIASGETNTCPCNLNLTRAPTFNSQADQVSTSMNSEIVEEGKHLFQTFVREEIRREGLIEPAKCLSPLCR